MRELVQSQGNTINALVSAKGGAGVNITESVIGGDRVGHDKVVSTNTWKFVAIICLAVTAMLALAIGGNILVRIVWPPEIKVEGKL